ncbi:MAG: prepilin peptidase [Acidobacteriia bacterium]|nr:prepilin peptidase [Terriglobia bacterium]
MGIVYFFIFVLGLVVGSFLNVCIVRLPQDQSVVRPRSHCPHCGTLIRAYDNIPVLSFLILRGRCRSCRAPISPMYPLVELFTGLLFLFCVNLYGLSPEALKYALLGSGLIVLIFTDLKFRLLPNEITVPGMALGILFSFFVPVSDRTLDSFVVLLTAVSPRAEGLLRWSSLSPVNSLAGLIFGAGILFVVGEIYFRLRGVEGMGLGDVKMMGLVGAFVGLKLTFLTILVGSILGTLVGLGEILFHQRDLKYELPFGTFLGCAALLLALFGTPLVPYLLP